MSLDDTEKWAPFHHPDWSLPIVRRRAGEEWLDILSGLGGVLFTGGRSVLWTKTFPTTQAYRSAISRLQKQGLLIKTTGKDKMPRLSLSAKGKEIRPAYFNPKKEWGSRWNKIWYMLIFDVPEKNRPYRDSLRMFLKQLRMGCLQKSVWITPRDIRPEYDDLQHTAGIDSVAYLLESRTVLHLDQQEMVCNAWDFEKLRVLQSRYLDVFTQNLQQLQKGLRNEEGYMSLLYLESEAYIQAMQFDPLLPTALLPDDYLGKDVWDLRGELRIAISRSLKLCHPNSRS